LPCADTRCPFEATFFEKITKRLNGFTGEEDLQAVIFGIRYHFTAVKQPALEGIFRPTFKFGYALLHSLDFSEIVRKPICRNASQT
jgi:hypothetical protein